jgi:hypothetical protein
MRSRRGFPTFLRVHETLPTLVAVVLALTACAESGGSTACTTDVECAGASVCESGRCVARSTALDASLDGMSDEDEPLGFPVFHPGRDGGGSIGAPFQDEDDDTAEPDAPPVDASSVEPIAGDGGGEGEVVDPSLADDVDSSTDDVSEGDDDTAPEPEVTGTPGGLDAGCENGEECTGEPTLDCCDPTNPCEQAENGVCDCDGVYTWDLADCQGMASGAGAIGEPCEVAEDCASGFCMPEEDELGVTGWPSGYCSSDCTVSNQCPEGSNCFIVREDGAAACLDDCSPSCRTGYVCEPVAEGACLPRCDAPGNGCPEGSQCAPTGFCEAEPAVCNSGEFACDDGYCIRASWECDEFADCGAGEDEVDCPSTCDPVDFLCDDGGCIPAAWVCDFVNDCPNDEDEVDCEYPDVPDEWGCSPFAYGADDGCHCDCGAWDPDCNDDAEGALGCLFGLSCVEPGVCEDTATP